MWEMLRKSINGIVNKVNTSNIQNIILELFNENLLRGKGLLCRAIMKAQMASPNFTHVYAALIAVINTKLPAIVKLLIERVLIQFQRAFKRNNKIVCMATTRMLAHLVNQHVVHELLALEILTLFLTNPTEDSVEIAADFMIECGQVLSDITPAGVNAIMESFRTILHEGHIDKKVQYTIENLFAVRKTKFAAHPGVIPELDLVEESDKITHTVSLEDQFEGQDACNLFQFDPNYEQTEAEWDEIKKEILGEEAERMNQEAGIVGGDVSEEEEEEEEDKNKKVSNSTFEVIFV
jgi:pre-mRNA-splicing factor CWC22